MYGWLTAIWNDTGRSWLLSCPTRLLPWPRPRRRDARLAAREHLRSSLEQVAQGTELRLRPITHLQGQPTLPTALRVDLQGGWAGRGFTRGPAGKSEGGGWTACQLRCCCNHLHMD